MTNKLIFPFLIILFSAIIIYGILNIKYNKKFLNNIEKFQNNYYYGYIDNIPISKSLKYKQYMRIHKNKIIEIK
jgi:hypothetical protein